MKKIVIAVLLILGCSAINTTVQACNMGHHYNEPVKMYHEEESAIASSFMSPFSPEVVKQSVCTAALVLLVGIVVIVIFLLMSWGDRLIRREQKEFKKILKKEKETL